MSTQALVCVANPLSDEPEREATLLLSACAASHSRCSWQSAGIALGVGSRVDHQSPAEHPQLCLDAERVLASVGDGLDWDPSWSVDSLIPKRPASSAKRLTSRRFATVIWERRSRRLVAARDPLGLEPLYYALLPGGGIALCSSGTALLELPGVSREIDRNVCAESLLLLPQQPGSTFFRDIRELPRACWLEWHDGALVLRRYHRIGSTSNGDAARDRVEHLRGLFCAAVARASATSPEIAVTLSGGLDSSSVFRVACAQPNTHVRAISAVFPNDPETQEDEYLEAALSGTGVQSLRFEPNVPFDLEQSLAAAEDPTWIPMLSTTIACALQARALGAKCVLTGEFGDFVAGSIAAPEVWLLRHGLWKRAWTEFESYGGGKTRQTLRFGRQALRLLIGPRWQRTPQRPLDLFRERMAGFMSRQTRSALAIEERLREFRLREAASEEPNRHTYEAFFDRQGNRVSRASWLVERLCGVRLEHPFCDPELVSWSAGLSFDERWAGGHTRAAFRRALAGIVPERILQRGSKARFDGPHSRYFDSVERSVRKPEALWPLTELLEIRGEEMLIRFSSDGLSGRHRALAALLLASWLRMHGRLKATQVD